MRDKEDVNLNATIRFVLGMLSEITARLLVVAGFSAVVIGATIPVWSLAILGALVGFVGVWLYFRD